MARNPASSTMRALAASQTLGRINGLSAECRARRVFAFFFRSSLSSASRAGIRSIGCARRLALFIFYAFDKAANAHTAAEVVRKRGPGCAGGGAPLVSL